MSDVDTIELEDGLRNQSAPPVDPAPCSQRAHAEPLSPLSLAKAGKYVRTHALRPGIIAMIGAALFFSANTALARLITKVGTNHCLVDQPMHNNSFPPIPSNFTSAPLASCTSSSAPYSSFQVLYVRALVVTIGCSAILFRSKSLPFLQRGPRRPHPVVEVEVNYASLVQSNVSWAFIRGLFGAIAMACSYYAVSTLPSLSEAVVLYGFNPVFSTVAARIILREKFSRFRIVGVSLFVAGVIVSVNPAKTFGNLSSGSTAEEWVARGVAFVGSFFNGVAIVAAKRMQPAVDQTAAPDTTARAYSLHWVSQAWWQGSISLGLAPLASLVFKFSTVQPGRGLDVLVLLAQGICALLGQCCVGFAVQRENAAIVGVLWNFDVVFAVMWQATLLGSQVTWYDGLGVVFIFLGSLVCVLEKAWLGSLAPDIPHPDTDGTPRAPSPKSPVDGTESSPGAPTSNPFNG